MNKKGFAISIVMYSIVFVLISIFYMLLGILKTRYTVNSSLREDIMNELNTSFNAADVLQRKIDASSCNPTWIDDMDTSDTSDDITYISGNNECVNFNYVWYSGKLWRITAIYPDGSMKLVTEDMLTSIYWGDSIEYDGSWIYQWLNEDFYDTLVNPNSIIKNNNTWNYSTTNNSQLRPESIGTQKTKEAPVGLLNSYEYYNSYRCIGSSSCAGPASGTNSSYGDSYLNIGYYWWLLNPKNSTYISAVSNVGGQYDGYYMNQIYGVRPSIVLKSGIEFIGKGTETSPFKIVGDKENPVNNTTLLSSRSIGEYVKFDNDIYRIVEINSGVTKLTKVDYLKDNGGVIRKYFATSLYFGKSTNTQSDDYWDYYLNNTWYSSISSNYKNMIVNGTYYLGNCNSFINYKKTICKDADLNSVTTKNCTKYTSSDDEIFIGKVGMPRYGEMFSSQLKNNYSSSSMWLITPHEIASGKPYGIVVHLYVQYHSVAVTTDGNYAVRPSITLKSTVKITGGTGYVGGDTNSPFEISG